MISPGRLVRLLKRSGEGWLDHSAPRIGAALAFYTLVSFAPLLSLAVAAGTVLFGDVRTELQVVEQVHELAGSGAASLVQDMIERTQMLPSGVPITVAGIVTLLLGASGIFVELRSALNTIWNITPNSSNRLWALLKGRLVSIGMVLAIGFLLVVSLIISVVLAAIGKYLGSVLPAPVRLLEAANFLLSFGGIAIMFTLILRYIPDARLPWRFVITGAILTAFLFTVGKSLIGLYLGRTAIGSLYGAGGSIVVLVAWVYYSAQIFLFGAEFTRSLAAPAIEKGWPPQ